MRFSVLHTLLSASVLGFATLVAGLGTSCSAPVTSGTAAPGDPFWMEQIKHQGTSPFNSNPSGYQVFRNVMDFGAKGDGVSDDTAAINAAISSGGRCGDGCGQSTVSPATVYFPPGTYMVSSPVVSYLYTQMIGDPKDLPVIKATANFAGIAIIDADPGWYVNQNNFYHSIRNFRLNTTLMPTSATGTGIHWQVSQATSLINIIFDMPTTAGNAHQGIWMENGSGGFMGDLVFNGGNFGMWVGNQQFTVRNVTINNANTAVYMNWNWGWTFQGLTINNCQVGLDFNTGNAGAEAIIDAVVTNTPIFFRTSAASNGVLEGAIVLNNIRLNNVPIAVGVLNGPTVLAGGTLTIDTWGQGNVFKGNSGAGTFVQANLASVPKAGSLLDSAGRMFGRGHPQYEDYAPGQFVSVKTQGAHGDGETDDTAALQAVFDQFAGCKIIFFDAGVYLVSDTLTIPAGTQVVGEAWSTILGGGSNFEDFNNPRPVVRVGESGSTGVLEITDMIFSTRGPAAGAIVVEWNVHDPAGQQGAAGTWDTHIILGGKAGTDLRASNCPTSAQGGAACFAAFMGLHLTTSSSAYLEGLWVWTADHDIDSGPQINIWSGRGIMSESQGPVWMVGTASEHNIIYQYYLHNARDHYMGLIQTETPYFQPAPSPPAPFQINSQYSDPSVGPGAAWALTVANSQDILVYGAGLYSFFQNYTQDCINNHACQQQNVNIDSASSVALYMLSTVAVEWMLSVNGAGVVSQASNANGFAETVTAWTSS